MWLLRTNGIFSIRLVSFSYSAMPKYTVDDVRKALDDITRGSSIAAAAIKYGIPRTTLSGKHHHVYPVEIKKGPATILTEEEEKHLENWMFHLGDAGFPITPDQLLDSVQHLVKELKRETPFTDGRPGRKWYKGFMRRHPEIKKKLSRNLSHPRTNVTQENILNWFKEVLDYVTKENLFDVLNDPERVFNTDESAFFLCPKGDHVLVRKSSKMVYNFVNNDDKECLTALIGGNAAGKLMPSMVVYAYQRVPAVVSELFPKSWAIGRSESGWMTSETFYEYVANIFHPWLLKENIKLPVILFVDGHSSHGTLHLSEFCQKNQIVLVALYPNSTHFLQPMDVSCFHPLKNGWKKAVRKWRFNNDGVKLKRENFAPLLEEVVTDVIKAETLTNGFRKCGLYPFTADAINFKDMMVKSTAEVRDLDPNVIARNDLRNADDINYELFVKCIEKALPPEQLREFKASGKEWSGNVEDKSLFEFWHKHVELIHSFNGIRTSDTGQSFINRDFNLEVESFVNNENDNNNNSISTENQTTLTFDFDCIPTVDLDGIECVPIEDILVVEQNLLMENQMIHANEFNERSVESDHSDSVYESDDFYDKDSDYSSTDDEVSDCKASNYKNSTIGDDSNSECDVGDDTKEEIHDQRIVPANIDTLPKNQDGQRVDARHTVDSHNVSRFPPNTPAAFAKVLFYPGEPKLSGKNKRSKKRKLPSVYSSTEYSEFLREKEREKEEIEKQKMQRKVHREEAKLIKENEKRDREEKRIEKREAMAVKKAELAAKKADAAMKKAKAAEKKADEAASRGSFLQKTKKRKIAASV